MTRRDVIYGSLFSGIGGFDLGFDRAGMQCAWQVEIDGFCRRVLAKHWPDVPRFEDIRDVGRHNLSPIDVICGGFPCQPHSVAGKRQGAADDRDLWPEYRRVIDELRPAWVVAENVPGIRTTILDAVLSDLDDLEYTATALVIPACALDAPHRRDRVWILAYSDGDRRAGSSSGHAALNQERDSSTRQPPRDYELYAVVSGGETLPYADIHGCERVEQQNGAGEEGEGPFGSPAKRSSAWSWWATEPDVGRVAYGVPNRVDRIRALGNAVVPQVTEWIGRYIMEIESR